MSARHRERIEKIRGRGRGKKNTGSKNGADRVLIPEARQQLSISSLIAWRRKRGGEKFEL